MAVNFQFNLIFFVVVCPVFVAGSLTVQAARFSSDQASVPELVPQSPAADVRVNTGSSSYLTKNLGVETISLTAGPSGSAELPPPVAPPNGDNLTSLNLDNLMLSDSSPNSSPTLTSCQDSPRQLKMLAIAQRSIILYCDVSSTVAQHDHLIQWKREPDLAPIFARQGTFVPYVHPNYEGRLDIVDDALLKIDPVKESDEGWYRCEIHFTRPDLCPMTPNRVHLSVQSHPQLIVNESSPEQVNKPAGSSDVQLQCSFSGTPQPEVTWTKYSWHRGYEVLRPSSRIAITPSTLTIRSFTKADSGRYQCRAANLVGEATHQISLVADGSVVLIVPPSNVTVDEGDEAVFHCKVDGHPSRIRYRWFRDGTEIAFPPPMASGSSAEVADGGLTEPVRSRFDRYTTIYSGQSSVLVINPTIRKDSGRYTCEGSNNEAMVRTPDAQLSVKYKPQFVNMKNFIFLPLGLNVNLTCSADANPAITKYSWAKGNNFDITGQRYRHSEDGRILNIQNVTRDDAGTYICFVTNDFATDKFEVEVQVTDPPTFMAAPRPLTQVLKGSGVTIACKATATIAPVVSWMKDGRPLDLNERIQLNDGNLIIHNVDVDDQGEYLCLAHNVAATVVQRTRVVVEDESRPHAPKNLTVETGTYSATLTWLPAYNRGMQSYIVQYRAIATPDLKLSSNRPVSPPPWQQMRVFPEGALTFTIYNLLPNSTYEFRVMARSLEPGDGLYSQPVIEKTKVARRLIATNSGAYDVAEEDMLLTLEELITQATTTITPTTTTTTTTTTPSTTVLVPFYEEEDAAPLSELLVTEEPPSEDYPAIFSNSPILRPNVVRALLTSRKVDDVDMTTTIQPVTQITMSTKAMVSDRSVDVPSIPESLMYVGPKPPAPRNVTGVALPRSITLRWSPPENMTSAAKPLLQPSHTCYTIEYMAGAEMEWRQLANVSASTDSFVLSNPTPKIVYRFRIAACNAKTIGYYSDTIVLVSEETSSLMQVSTETALLGIAGCAVVLIIIVSVVVVCVRYNRSPSPYDRHRQRQCKFVQIDGSGGGSPLTPASANTPPNKLPPILLNGSSGAYMNGNGLLTTAKIANGKSMMNGISLMNGHPRITCPNSTSMGSCNGPLLLGSSSSSNSGGTGTLPKDKQLHQQLQWQLSASAAGADVATAGVATAHSSKHFGVLADRDAAGQWTGQAAASGAYCGHCRGSGVTPTGMPCNHHVFPDGARRTFSSSGEEIEEDEEDMADERTQCLSKYSQQNSSSNSYHHPQNLHSNLMTYSNHSQLQPSILKSNSGQLLMNRSQTSSSGGMKQPRQLGRLEALLLMEDGTTEIVNVPPQQQQQMKPRRSREQMLLDGEYDNISEIIDGSLYQRSRSPLGRFIEAAGGFKPQHGANPGSGGGNSLTTTTDVTSRSSSLNGMDANSQDGAASSYSNVTPRQHQHDGTSNPIYANASDLATTGSRSRVDSPRLSEMKTPMMLVNIITPPSSQHLSPRSNSQNNYNNNKAVSFEASSPYQAEMVVSETCI